MISVALLVIVATMPSEALDRAGAALADFRPEAAIKILEAVREQGPLPHASHVQLYEQLGIAYAYIERAEDAVSAFSKMLALDPARAISYTLSPKVTFLFEEARKRSAARVPPSVDVSWPRDLFVDREVAIDVEVVADPESFLSSATLFYRAKGELQYRSQELPLPKKGSRPVRVELPPVAPAAHTSEILELYLVAQDIDRNEVLMFGGPQRPREIALAFELPDPWYGKWWVWAVAGTVVAAGAGAAVFAVTREPGATVGGAYEVVR